MQPGNKASPGIVYSALVLTRGAWNEASPRIVLRTGAHQGSLGTRRAQGLYTLHWCSPGEQGNKAYPGIVYCVLVLTRGAWNEASPGLVLCSGAYQGSLGTRLAQGLYSALVLTRGAWNEASPRIVLCSGAYQGSLGTRLAQGLYSALVLTRGAWNEASPRIVLRTGAHQGSRGTRHTQGLYTAYWCSPGEPGMRLAQGLYSILALTVLIWRTSNSFYLRRFNVSSSSSVREK